MLVKFCVCEYQETDACFGVIFQSVGKETRWFRTVWFSKSLVESSTDLGTLTIEVDEDTLVRRFNSVFWRQHWALVNEIDLRKTPRVTHEDD